MGQSVGFVHIWLQNRVPLEKGADSVCTFYFTLSDMISGLHCQFSCHGLLVIDINCLCMGGPHELFFSVGRLLLNLINFFFNVEYIYRFVSLGGLRTKSMTSQRGTLQDGR